MHQIVGWVGAVMVILCATSGTYILAGSLTSRIPELQHVIVSGIFAVTNVLLGILYVRYGDIQAHKQCMGWGIVWSAAPGILRAASYVLFLATGSTPCRTKCDNLTRGLQGAFNQGAPDFCNIL